MVVGSNLVVPIVLWGKQAPTHCISAILMTSDMKNIVTACNDAQLCVWDLTANFEVYPRHMMFGHTAAISCIALGSDQEKTPLVVSASENGEMCLWDISDGRCIESNKLTYKHSNIQAFRFRNTKDVRLVCNGFYPEIVVIDPYTFEVVLTLSSHVSPDWISACCVLKPAKVEDDVIVAISNSGAVKVWALNGTETKAMQIFEDESKQIRCLNAQTLTCCQYNQRTVLIVCAKYWQIYDAADFTLLCSEANRCGERWAGGDFLSVDRVVVWSNEGKGYLYKLPTNANTESDSYHNKASSSPHAYYVLDFYMEKAMACAPAMIVHASTMADNKTVKLLVRGDSEGQVVIWKLPEVSEKQMTLVRQESFDRLPVLLPKCAATLQDIWEKLYRLPAGILDGFFDIDDAAVVTASVYIPSQDQLVCGRSDGTIILVPTTQCIILQMLENKNVSQEKLQVLTLKGHDGWVNCVLYPCNESTRYEPKHLLSGGADFSVCLWDIYEGVKLHTYTVHGGEINQLLVPPNNCNLRVLTSICSVAADHSVSLLSLKERKCILLASRHLFPVQSIRWRPLDDFMVVSCSDGTVYVWQMETGHLDRVVHGLTAEEVLNNCDENATPIEQLTNPSVTLSQAIKRHNLATFKNLAQQKLHALGQHQQMAGTKMDLLQPQDFPMYIQGIRTNKIDPESHVVFFDTEALIVQLLTNEYASMSFGELEAKGLMAQRLDKRRSSAELNEAPPMIAGILSKVKDTADSVSQKIQASVDAAGFSQIPNQGSPNLTRKPSKSDSPLASPALGSCKQRPEKLMIRMSNLVMDIAQLFISVLHAWDLDPDLDILCINKLGLLKPKFPICFGLISRDGHMSLMMPGWHRSVCVQDEATGRLNEDNDVNLTHHVKAIGGEQMMTQLDIIGGGKKIEAIMRNPSDCLSEMSLKQAIDKEILMFSRKARWQVSAAVSTQHLLSIISVANTLMSMNHATFRTSKPTIRNKSVKKSGIVVLDGEATEVDKGSPDTMVKYQAQYKQGWSLLATHHCVLLPELVDSEYYFAPQLEMLARLWQDRCLEIREAAQALLLAELHRIGPDGRKALLDEWSPHLPAYVDPLLSILSTESHAASGEEEVEGELEQLFGGDSPLHKPSKSFESRRKQATAIVMLAVLGAEFGLEILPHKKVPEDPVKTKKGSLEGFTTSNYLLAQHTSKALTFLLQQPPCKKLPANTPIRRAAIDLIGRGFPVWEPYLDVSAVLLGLLELCIGADKLIPNVTFGLPLSPSADACRSARHALSLIATARPAVFIITIAKEVTRYLALAQTAPQSHLAIHNSVLVRAKSEILRVIELLVDKMPSDVADQIVEAMEVIIHCLDANQLKAKGLQELFPAICRFSMVTCCRQTHRIWVGAKNGSLAFYELKQNSKCQLIPGHAGQIIAVSVSPDGKFIATYSHVDQKLKFWQTSSSSLFGIGSQHMKCVREIATQPIQVNQHTNLLKLVRIVWTEARVIVLLTQDGSEYKYYV